MIQPLCGIIGGYTMKIKKKCPFCSNVTEVEVKDADMRKYEGGMLVQRAFPYLTPMQRDVIINGCCYATTPYITNPDIKTPNVQIKYSIRFFLVILCPPLQC